MLNRTDTKLHIEILLESKRRLDRCTDKAEELFGTSIIEGEMFQVVYQVLEKNIYLIETASELPVDLSWYIWDNDCGRNGFEAGVVGDMRSIRTVDDLLDLAIRECKERL